MVEKDPCSVRDRDEQDLKEERKEIKGW